MEDHLRTELVVDALKMAVGRSKPAPGLVHHSDQGVQYTSLSFSERLEEVGIVPSMGRTGSALDNAMAESFVSTLKAELVGRLKFPSRRERQEAGGGGRGEEDMCALAPPVDYGRGLRSTLQHASAPTEGGSLNRGDGSIRAKRR